MDSLLGAAGTSSGSRAAGQPFDSLDHRLGKGFALMDRLVTEEQRHPLCKASPPQRRPVGKSGWPAPLGRRWGQRA